MHGAMRRSFTMSVSDGSVDVLFESPSEGAAIVHYHVMRWSNGDKSKIVTATGFAAHISLGLDQQPLT